MNSLIGKFLKDIEDNKKKIFKLSGTEREITKKLFKLFGWDKAERYRGLFGWKHFTDDGCMRSRINDDLVVFEVKKIKKKGKDGYEYDYWHALSQGLIYSYQQQRVPSEENFVVLCIIFDWGRATDKGNLDKDERGFLDQFRDKVRFLRVSMSNSKFIEHNMNTNWEIIK